MDNELLELEYSSTTVQIDNDKQTLVTAMEDIESVLTTLEAKVQSFEDEIVELEQILPIRFARMTEEEIAEVEHNVANDKQQFSDIQQKTIDMRASISKLRDEIQAAEDTADVISAVRELRQGLLHTVPGVNRSQYRHSTRKRVFLCRSTSTSMKQPASHSRID